MVEVPSWVTEVPAGNDPARCSFSAMAQAVFRHGKPTFVE